MESYKIILIGDSSVGKTNFLTQYVNGKFTEEYNSTVGIEFKDKIIVGWKIRSIGNNSSLPANISNISTNFVIGL